MPMTNDGAHVPMRTEAKKHAITLDERAHLRVTGVTDVVSCDEHTVTICTVYGILTVEGDGLHVLEITLEEGRLLLDGRVSALYYTEEAPAKAGGFFARLFQ